MRPGMIAIVLLAVVLIGGLVLLARTITDNQTRRHLADLGLTADEIRTLFTAPSPLGYGSLRAALVSIGVGGALMVEQFLPFDASDPFGYGLVIVSAGVGLLAYLALLPLLRGRWGGADERRL